MLKDIRPAFAPAAGIVFLFFALFLGPNGPGAAQASGPMTLTFAHGNAWAARVPVVLYFSAGKVTATTDRLGRATFPPQDGEGFWVEIEGLRLAKFFSVDNVPLVIDIDKVGTMKWSGGRAS
jgi:hypothetical protein